jgi:hypothetical protein
MARLRDLPVAAIGLAPSGVPVFRIASPALLALARLPCLTARQSRSACAGGAHEAAGVHRNDRQCGGMAALHERPTS